MSDMGRRADTRNSKARLIVDAAYQLFLEHGFDAVSTDLIAKTAGVSKATLYAHFVSKEALFAEVLTRNCAEFSDRICIPDSYDGDLSAALRRFALDFILLFQDDRGLALYRLVVGETYRFPQVARAFETAGPSEMTSRLIRLMRQIAEHGDLTIADFDVAASQFLALIEGRLLFDRTLGLPPMPQAEVDRHVEAAIWLFLKGYTTAALPA